MAITRTKIGNLWFNYRGDYDNSTYKKDDIVIWNNTDYLNIREKAVLVERPEQNTQYYYNVQTTTDLQATQLLNLRLTQMRLQLFVGRFIRKKR